jgi:hypothetical protein
MTTDEPGPDSLDLVSTETNDVGMRLGNRD